MARTKMQQRVFHYSCTLKALHFLACSFVIYTISPKTFVCPSTCSYTDSGGRNTKAEQALTEHKQTNKPTTDHPNLMSSSYTLDQPSTSYSAKTGTPLILQLSHSLFFCCTVHHLSVTHSLPGHNRISSMVWSPAPQQPSPCETCPSCWVSEISGTEHLTALFAHTEFQVL